MQSSLPENHGLPEELLDGEWSLTDVQSEALALGVARGASLLVVAPPSTGKTRLGVWALLSWLRAGPSRRAVYLVPHRALARRMFEELAALPCARHLHGEPLGLVCAQGDTVEDAAGGLPARPLDATLLVTTYEKYLTLLAGTGLREDLSPCAVVCDGLQFLGDAQLGRDIELLLTLLRRTRWGQFVGLSARLDARDAHDVKDWLGVPLVHQARREKPLRYECRTPTRVRVSRTDQPEAGVQDTRRPPSEPCETHALLRHLSRDPSALPIVVFCMTWQRAEEAALDYARALGAGVSPAPSLPPGLKESTAAARALATVIPRRLGFHSAELLEEERRLVEDPWRSGQLEVIFVSSPLAVSAGLPFRTAVFDSWLRWNPRTRGRDPLPASEFHDMADRVGRMGSGHAPGRVFWTASDTFFETKAMAPYFQPDPTTPLVPRIDPQDFTPLVLQLVSSGVCGTAGEVAEVLSSSFSARREQAAHPGGLVHWRQALTRAIDALRTWGFLSGTPLHVTEVGRQVALSGLLPHTAAYLLEYLARQGAGLQALVPDGGASTPLDYCLLNACLTAPEFSGRQRTRFIPEGFAVDLQNGFAERYAPHLAEPRWQTYRMAAHAAALLLEGVEGVPLHRLEDRFPGVRAGTIRDLRRDVGWVLSGLSRILTAATQPEPPPGLRPLLLPVRRLAGRLEPTPDAQ